MQQVTLTVQAERCWCCPALIHPSEPLRQRQMVTAVETGLWRWPRQWHELVRLCQACDEELRATEQYDRACRRRFWGWVIGGVAVWHSMEYLRTQGAWLPAWGLGGGMALLVLSAMLRWPLIPPARAVSPQRRQV